jgi:ribonucleoside-diphosphate reductase alpha chain
MHLDVLLAAAHNVDSAVSKTCNVAAGTSWEDFKGIYVGAWKGGAKGCTTYQIGGKRFGILRTNEDGTKSCQVDPVTGKRDCDG